MSDLELATKTPSSNSLNISEDGKGQNEDTELVLTSTKKAVDSHNDDKKFDEQGLDAPPKTMSNIEGGRGQMKDLDEKKLTGSDEDVKKGSSIKRQKSNRIANAANEYINNINKLSTSSTNSSISSMSKQNSPNKISNRLNSYLAAVSTTSSTPTPAPAPVENRPRKCSNAIKEKSKMLESVLNPEPEEQPVSPVKSSPTSNSISSMANKSSSTTEKKLDTPTSPSKTPTEGNRRTSVSSFVKKQQEAYAASLIKDKGEDPSTKPIPSTNPRLSNDEATALSNKNRQSKLMFEQMAKSQANAPVVSNSSSRINTLDRSSLSSKNKHAKELFEQMAKGDKGGVSASPSSSSFSSTPKRNVGSISRKMEEKKVESKPVVKEEPIKRELSHKEFKKEEVKPVVKEEVKKEEVKPVEREVKKEEAKPVEREVKKEEVKPQSHDDVFKINTSTSPSSATPDNDSARELANKNKQSKQMFEQIAKDQHENKSPSSYSPKKFNTEESQALSDKNRRNKQMFEQLAKDKDSSSNLTSQTKLFSSTEALALSSKNKKSKELFEKKFGNNPESNNNTNKSPLSESNTGGGSKSNRILELQKRLIDLNTTHKNSVELAEPKKFSKSEISTYENLLIESERRHRAKIVKARMEQEQREREREAANEECRELEYREKMQSEQKRNAYTFSHGHEDSNDVNDEKNEEASEEEEEVEEEVKKDEVEKEEVKQEEEEEEEVEEEVEEEEDKKEEVKNDEIKKEDDKEEVEEEEEEENNEEETEMNHEVDIKDLKPMAKVSSITELQERLKKSIDDLRAKRKAQNNNSIHSRDELLRKRLKRKHDRKEQIQKKKEKRRKTNDMVGMDLPESQATESAKATKTKEVEENVSFGKIVFDEEVAQKKKKGPTDTLGRLKQAEAKKEKLEKLKSVDKEKAEALEEKIQWSKAMKMVEGEKIKDDPKLLKKTLKREQKLKERSAKKWNDRQKTVARQMKEKQKKREENIKARMMNKKGKGAKGKKRHGLEGSGLKRK